MSIGPKAIGLQRLQQLYPKNTPPFEVFPFSEIIGSYDQIIRTVQADVGAYLAGKLPRPKLELKLRSVKDRVTIDQKSLIAIDNRVRNMGWSKVSVRTSALAEDGLNSSFAGMYVSFVDIEYSKIHIKKYILKCFLSLFDLRVIEYAKSRNIDEIEFGGSVIVQKMVYGQKSGVMFTENGNGELTLAYSDDWKNTTVEGQDALAVSLSKASRNWGRVNTELQKVARYGLELEAYLGAPVDIEWSFDRGEVMLLQLRPQTTATTDYDLTWDSTNISENYPGLTLPLTYSFIQELYSRVYPSFFRLLGISDKQLQKNQHVFQNVLGYVQGRVYYRIDNWYELVKLIPGQKNQVFFEAMLNPVRKRQVAAPRSRWTLLNPEFIYLSCRLGWLMFRSNRLSTKFKKQFLERYQIYERLMWGNMSAVSSLRHIRAIRSDLLELWSVPILNDVKVMIFHGILKTILTKKNDNELYLNFLRGLQDQASVRPLRQLRDLGIATELSMRKNNIADLGKLAKSQGWGEIEKLALNFIDEFGGRTPDELQLENPRLSEDIMSVVKLAYSSRKAKLEAQSRKVDLSGFSFMDKLMVRFSARHARRAIDYRERFRFNRAQVFGVARKAYLSIGKRLSEANVISKSDDVFWLTETEIEGVIEGHNWGYDLRNVVLAREEQSRIYKDMPFWMHISGAGPIAATQIVDTTVQRGAIEMAGVGVSAGRLSGEAVVVRAFDPALNIQGKILVAQHIDPGWTLLLTQAAAVVTEQGNPLSHVAIVSREIGIPAVVGVSGAITKLKTGENITIDGVSGEIIREA